MARGKRAVEAESGIEEEGRLSTSPPLGLSRADPDDIEALRDALDPNKAPPGDPVAFHDAVEANGVSEFGEGDMELQREFEARERDTTEVLRSLRELDQGNNVKWGITRIGAENPTDDGFLDSWPSSLMTLERLRDKFGAGTYYLAARRNGKYAGHKTITIAGDAPRRGPQANMNTGQQQPFNFSEFLAQQREIDRQRQAHEEERERRAEEREEKRSRDRMAMIAAVATPAATVLAALFANKGPDLTTLVTALRPAPPTDPILLMQGLKTLMPEPQPLTPQPDAIDKAISIMEKIEAFKGNPNGETGWMDVLKEAVKSVGPGAGQIITAVVQRAQAVQAERRATQDAREPQAQLPAPSSPEMPSAGQDMNLLQAARLIPWLKSQVEKFLPAAAKRRDPELYAALLLEELPEDQEPQTLMQFIERPDWFEWLKSLDARVTHFPQWFAQLRAHLIDYMKEDESPPAAPGQPVAPGQPLAPEQPTASGLALEGTVPIGRHAGKRVAVVHVDGGEHASEEPSADEAPQPPSLLKGGA